MPHLFTAMGAVLIHRQHPDRFGRGVNAAADSALAFLHSLWTIYFCWGTAGTEVRAA
ncbi:MAG: hypothetical protein WD673_06245 [Alphaproteobacteria bacterium]